MAASKKAKTNFPIRNLVLVIGTATLTAIVCYVIAHQLIRGSANDPQTFLSQEIAEKLSQGEPSQKPWLGARKKVELSLDTRLFYIIYNDQGEIATTSAFLNSQLPELPKGVLDAAAKKGSNTITWQPADGIREAIVVRPYKSAGQSGYILIGRSLDAAERLTRDVAIYIFLGWLCIVSAAGIVAMFLTSHKKTGH